MENYEAAFKEFKDNEYRRKTLMINAFKSDAGYKESSPELFQINQKLADIAAKIRSMGKSEEFVAERDNRIAVTAKWLFNNKDQLSAYMLSVSNDELGLDPWTTITGVDAAIDGSKIILAYGSTGEKKVSPNFKVYVDKKTFEELKRKSRKEAYLIKNNIFLR